jgi:hypothetical protein
MSETGKLPPVSSLERPRCKRCGTRMELVRVETCQDRAEKRFFGCRKCNFIETKIVYDPLRSDAVARLADGLKPPS